MTNTFIAFKVTMVRQTANEAEVTLEDSDTHGNRRISMSFVNVEPEALDIKVGDYYSIDIRKHTNWGDST